MIGNYRQKILLGKDHAKGQEDSAAIGAVCPRCSCILFGGVKVLSYGVSIGRDDPRWAAPTETQRIHQWVENEGSARIRNGQADENKCARIHADTLSAPKASEKAVSMCRVVT